MKKPPKPKQRLEAIGFLDKRYFELGRLPVIAKKDSKHTLVLLREKPNKMAFEAVKCKVVVTITEE